MNTAPVTPLDEVMRRVDAALPKLHNTIGRYQLIDLCLQCTRSECNVKASNCLAYQRELDRKRDQHARNRKQRNANARARRAANPEKYRERNREYQRDPVYLAVLRVKRRQKTVAAGGRPRPGAWVKADVVEGAANG